MRIIHDVYKEGPVKTVNVYPHDSGMVYHHDYSCPICSVHHAVLDLSQGIFQPCRSCMEKGWAVVKYKPKKKNIIKRIFRC